MTWSWSHTHEAYDNAETNLRALSQKTLAEIAAEWDSWDGDVFAPQIDIEKFNSALRMREQESAEILSNFIWGSMSNEPGGRSCTTGGHYAYSCPFGCEVHQVSFDDPEPDDSVVVERPAE